MSYPELTYWIDHGGSMEYRRCCEVWALEAAADADRQRAEWVAKAPEGKRRAVLMDAGAA